MRGKTWRLVGKLKIKDPKTKHSVFKSVEFFFLSSEAHALNHQVSFKSYQTYGLELKRFTAENHTREFKSDSFDFEIVRLISDHNVPQSVQLPLHTIADVTRIILKAMF